MHQRIRNLIQIAHQLVFFGDHLLLDLCRFWDNRSFREDAFVRFMSRQYCHLDDHFQPLPFASVFTRNIRAY